MEGLAVLGADFSPIVHLALADNTVEFNAANARLQVLVDKVRRRVCWPSIGQGLLELFVLCFLLVLFL